MTHNLFWGRNMAEVDMNTGRPDPSATTGPGEVYSTTVVGSPDGNNWRASIGVSSNSGSNSVTVRVGSLSDLVRRLSNLDIAS